MTCSFCDRMCCRRRFMALLTFHGTDVGDQFRIRVIGLQVKSTLL